MQTADYVVILLYMIGVLGVGVYFSRRQRDSADYFVGGRGMPWFAVGISLLASLLSTLSYLATPGELIRYGLAYPAGFLVLPLAFVVITFVWLPFFMRLRLISVYEYLEQRFGLAACWLGAGLFIFVLRLIWMAVLMYAASRAVAHITYDSAMETFRSGPGWELSFGAWVVLLTLAGGIFATVYTMLGGIKAVIWTDVVQFVILAVGAIMTLIIVAHDSGTGVVDWWQTLNTIKYEPMVLASWDITERTTVLWTCMYIFFWYACTFCSDQVAMQRYFATPSLRAAVKSNIVNFMAIILLYALLSLCGMALLTYYTKFPAEIVPGISNPQDPLAADNVFPHFIAHVLPVGISGLVVAALLAAAMSSIDSGINSITSVLTVDVFRKLKPKHSPREELALARVLTVILGVVVTALAIAMMQLPKDSNIIDICIRTFECGLGPLTAMFMVGMFLTYVGQRAVIISTLAGVLMCIVIAWWRELGWLFVLIDVESLDVALKTVRRPTTFLITPISLAFSFSLAAVLGIFMPDPHPEKARLLSWRGVVFGKEPTHGALPVNDPG